MNWDIVRWFNVFASGLVVSLLIMGSIARWHVMPGRIRRILPWIIFTYLVIAYGSAEVALSSGVAPGYRVALMALNLSGLIVALLFGINDREYHPPEGGGYGLVEGIRPPK